MFAPEPASVLWDIGKLPWLPLWGSNHSLTVMIADTVSEGDGEHLLASSEHDGN